MVVHRKIKVVAEKEALLQLSSNNDFCKGVFLKHIFKNLSDIFLIMDESEFEAEWNDSESDLRKFFDAYDIAKPKAMSALKQIYKNPSWCPQLDPFALWLFNKDNENFRDYLGVWAISALDIDDQFFCIELPHGYQREEVINGPKNNGWGNYMAQLTKPQPPSNSIIINDRHLLLNTNESYASRINAQGRLNGFWGLNNLIDLLEELLPSDLRIPFHILIYCQHPQLSIEHTDNAVNQFINDIKSLRKYEITIEFVYDRAMHNRGLYSNYYTLYVDRAFNAFRDNDKTRLNGENKFNFKTYLNNPFSLGETEYDSARREISIVKDNCINAHRNPNTNTNHLDETIRVKTDCPNSFHNRLFDQSVQNHCT